MSTGRLARNRPISLRQGYFRIQPKVGIYLVQIFAVNRTHKSIDRFARLPIGGIGSTSRDIEDGLDSSSRTKEEGWGVYINPHSIPVDFRSKIDQMLRSAKQLKQSSSLVHTGFMLTLSVEIQEEAGKCISGRQSRPLSSAVGTVMDACFNRCLTSESEQ